MNPWRKRRRQKLRRQNEGSYTARMIYLADLGIEVTMGPMRAGGPWLGAVGVLDVPFEVIKIPLLLQRDDETDAQYIERAYGIDFTKPTPDMHMADEFFGPETLGDAYPDIPSIGKQQKKLPI